MSIIRANCDVSPRDIASAMENDGEVFAEIINQIKPYQSDKTMDGNWVEMVRIGLDDNGRRLIKELAKAIREDQP